MAYVVTFEKGDGSHESFTVGSYCVELAIMDAKEKADEKYNHSGFYRDSDVFSIIRV